MKETLITPGHTAHDTWCADDDWDDLTPSERQLWEETAGAVLRQWGAEG